MTLINLGAQYPNQVVTVVLKGNAKDNLKLKEAKGKKLGSSGVVTEYKGMPEVIITQVGYVTVF